MFASWIALYKRRANFFLKKRWDVLFIKKEERWLTNSKNERNSAPKEEKKANKKIKGKSPGPDGITQAIIAKAHAAIPDKFFLLFSTLLNLGYHPKPWKQATGVILKKAGKPDYSIPKAYRVISLLNCLGKVSERICARRLGYLAETSTLLHNSQLGGRQKKSAIDTAFLLRNTVERNKREGRKTSTLFLDVKERDHGG